MVTWGWDMRYSSALAARSLCALATLSLALNVWGQEAPPSIEQQVQTLKVDVSDAALAGHNAWMLTSSALVLFMTAPGLAMFYSGLVRKKNVLGVMMQCMFLMGLMTVIWGLYGYSLAFGGIGNPYIGNGDYLFMNGVQRHLPADANARRNADVQCRLLLAHSPAHAHAVPGHVLHHHAGADLRRVRRADEVQHDGRVHDPVGHARLLPAVPLGVGRRHAGVWHRRQGRERHRRRRARLRRRHRRAHQLGRLGPGLRPGDGQAAGLWAASRCRRTI